MDVNKQDVSSYGIITPGKSLKNDITEILSLVEKPSIEDAPSQMAVVGRYIIEPSIFNELEKQNRGSSNEIQLTDAIAKRIGKSNCLGFKFKEERFSKLAEKLIYEEKPEKLNYPQNHPRYRFYGNNIKKMIDIAMEWEEGELKDKLIANIANHMKKCFLNWNKDSVDDKVIFNHLSDLSNGTLKVPDSKLPLTDSSEFLKNRVKTNNNYKSKKKRYKR